jgi:(R,R)-butanediol dehydrogenase/meso-butanediol dehydrogenase/diacetyl reductase
MLAVRWHGRFDVRVEDGPETPPPGPGEVTVAPSWCGICGTDVEEWQHGPSFIPVDAPHPLTGGCAPITLGHEFGGVVVDVGPAVTELAIGERVAVDTLVYCGSCRWCLRGEVVRCPQVGFVGIHANGGLAERCTVPARMCLPLPSGVPDEAGALAEPLAVAARALRRGAMAAGDAVAIVGGGSVGLLALQAALALGAREVHVVEPLEARHELALRLGASSVRTPAEAGELACDVSLECAGAPPALGVALETLERGGRCVLVGLHDRPVELRPLGIVAQELSLIGSFSHVYHRDLRLALDLIGRGRIELEPLISDRIPLADAVDRGLHALREAPHEHLKILVGMGL